MRKNEINVFIFFCMTIIIEQQVDY